MSHVPLIRPDMPFYESLPDLSPASVKTFLVLARHANRRTGKCWPKVATIAEQSGLKERAVRGAIADLVERGLVFSERKKRNNIYTLRPASDCRSQPDQDLHQNAGQDTSRPAHSDTRPARSCRPDLHQNAGYMQNPTVNPPNGTPKSARARSVVWSEVNHEFIIDDATRAELRRRYNDIDVDQQILAAAEYVRCGDEQWANGPDNPERFLRSWLNKAQAQSRELAKGRPLGYLRHAMSVGRADRDAMTDPRELSI